MQAMAHSCWDEAHGLTVSFMSVVYRCFPCVKAICLSVKAAQSDVQQYGEMSCQNVIIKRLCTD